MSPPTPASRLCVLLNHFLCLKNRSDLECRATAEPLTRVRKETHNATERRRRDRIRERMQELKDAVPGCTSSKKIDILTFAVAHIQTLTDRYQDLLLRSDAMLRDYLAHGGDVDYLGPHAASLPSAAVAASEQALMHATTRGGLAEAARHPPPVEASLARHRLAGPAQPLPGEDSAKADAFFRVAGVRRERSE